MCKLERVKNFKIQSSGMQISKCINDPKIENQKSFYLRFWDISNKIRKWHINHSTSDPVASEMEEYELSGAQEMHSTTCSCSRSSALHSFVATTHTRTVWSLEQLAISVPSWFGRTIRTHSLCPVNVFTQ